MGCRDEAAAPTSHYPRWASADGPSGESRQCGEFSSRCKIGTYDPGVCQTLAEFTDSNLCDVGLQTSNVPHS
jgi:hypothetical protein